MEPRVVSYLISKFALQFCNELDKKNNIASPLSVEILLALLALPSYNKTHDELLKALDFPDRDAIRSSFGYIKSILDNTEGVTLQAANRIYLDAENCKLLDKVKRDSEELCRGGVEAIDSKCKEAAADKINAWVAEITEGKISNLILPHEIPTRESAEESTIILMNAIYFKGSWKNKFKSEYVKEWPFFVDNHTQTRVQMMLMAETCFFYGESCDLNAKLLRMDYESKDACMVIVLPHEIEGLDRMLQKLADGYDLLSVIKAMYWEELEIAIPKFKIENDITLNDVLPKLGMNAIFDKENTDIRLMNRLGKTYLSVGKQKAIIEVDEEGSVAVACTRKVMREVQFCRREKERQNFIAWRPFLYMIMISDIVIFMGTYRGKT